MTVDRELLRHLHNMGLSAAQIAERAGCTARTVTRWRASEGLTQPGPVTVGVRVSAERLAAAERMLDDGAPYQEVARTLGMHQHTLRRHFPGRQWTKHQSGVFAAMVTHMNRQMNRKAA